MKKLLYITLALALGMSACKKSDPPLPDNTLNFTASAQGFESTDSTATVTLNLSRATDAAIAVSVSLQTSGVTYGTEFSTTPAVVNNVIALSIPAGGTSVSFKVSKKSGVFLNGDEYLTFTLKSAASPIVIGTTSTLKLSFAAITSTGTTLTLDGGAGGASAVNSVFVDLSANEQTDIARASWDLGFYNGDDFRVILNNTTSASTVMVNKTDINAVSASDINIADLQLGFGKGTFSIFDDVNGDLTKTAIAQVSASDTANKVYVINRVGGSGITAAAEDLYKVRILRATNGYTLQYAKLNETTYKTLTITKDASYNFSYASFDTGAVSVEPAKDHWDLEWTYSIYYTSTIPYAFSDLVLTNYLGGVQAAEVMTSTVTYDAYAEANIASTTFSTSRNTISSVWRATTGTVGVFTDRFFVIKDAAGNVYKLKFVSFTTQDGGTRGYPVIQYALVKKGS